MTVLAGVAANKSKRTSFYRELELRQPRRRMPFVVVSPPATMSTPTWSVRADDFGTTATS